MRKRYFIFALVALLVVSVVQFAFPSAKATQIEFMINGVTDPNTLAPASAGVVYTYAAGTTTNKTTWTDRNKTTAATNPIVLNSMGQAQVYGDGIYKFVVKDAVGGATLYTYDNIAIGVSAGTEVDISEYTSLTAAVAAIGSVTRTTLLVGSTTTLTANTTVTDNITIQHKSPGLISCGTYTVLFNGEFNAGRSQAFDSTCGTEDVTFGRNVKSANVEWWGAVGDDSTVNTAAFNSAKTSGVPIDIGVGTFVLGPLAAHTTDLKMTGQGRSTVLKFNTTGTGITLSRTAYKIAHIANMSFKAGASTPALFIDNSFDNTLLENLFFENTAATVAIQNTSAYGLTIRKCKWSFFTGIGIVLQQSASDTPYYSYNVSINNIDISNHTGIGIKMYGGGANAINDSVIESCSLGAITIDNVSNTSTLLGLSLNNVYFELNSTHDIAITDNGTYWTEISAIGVRFIVPAGITLGQKSKIVFVKSYALSGSQTITGSSVAAITFFDSNGTWVQSGTYYWLDIGNQKLNTSVSITYDPAWNADSLAPSIGNGTITGKYTRIGNTVTTMISLVSGSTTSFGAGSWFFQLPLKPAMTGQVGSAVLGDASDGFVPGFVYGTYNTKTMYLYSRGTDTYASGVTATFPFTWVNTDYLYLSLTYETME